MLDEGLSTEGTKRQVMTVIWLFLLIAWVLRVGGIAFDAVRGGYEYSHISRFIHSKWTLCKIQLTFSLNIYLMFSSSG